MATPKVEVGGGGEVEVVTGFRIGLLNLWGKVPILLWFIIFKADRLLSINMIIPRRLDTISFFFFFSFMFNVYMQPYGYDRHDTISLLNGAPTYMVLSFCKVFKVGSYGPGLRHFYLAPTIFQ